MHFQINNQFYITDMCEDEELHNILQWLQDQTEWIENLFVDEKVPLAAEDFSNIIIQHLLDKAALVNLTMVLSSQKGSKVG